MTRAWDAVPTSAWVLIWLAAGLTFDNAGPSLVRVVAFMVLVSATWTLLMHMTVAVYHLLRRS